jgi:formylglycine-generating enzyme required for sulfatase activity
MPAWSRASVDYSAILHRASISGWMGSSHVDWVPPDSFDEYRLVKALGRGSMGQVWLAHDTVLDRLVAVKFIAELPVPDAVRQRFLTEARAAARVQHSNIIAVYRVGEIGPRPYLISEYVRGDSLDKITRPIAWPRLLEIAIDLARGLAAAHRRGVLHRDLKPANAIVSETGDVKLLDFGLAKLLPLVVPPHAAAPPGQAEATGSEVPGDPTLAPKASSESFAPPPEHSTQTDDVAASALARATGGGTTLPEVAPPGSPWARESRDCHPAIDPSRSITSTGEVMGTPAYLPPEVWYGEPPTLRSDVYSLGALLYELVAGAPPLRGNSPEALQGSVGAGDPPPLARAALGIDPGFAAVVDRCLRHDPAERFASGDVLREALEMLAAGDKTVARMTEPLSPGRSRQALLLGTVLVCALAFAVFAYHMLDGEHSSSPIDAAVLPAPPDAPAPRPPVDAAPVIPALPDGTPGSCPEEMVPVVAGTFLMGSPEGEGDSDEQPQHEVTLSAYCIDKTEVTVAAYAACVAAAGCSAAPLTANLTNYSHEEVSQLSRWCNRADRPVHPMNCVDWDQAAAYCTWKHARLPTEAEWEYAARGHDGRVYPWGNGAPSATRLNACGNECVAMGKRVMIPFAATYDGDDGWETTAPVGSYPEGASPFGALDMAGNVGEWTADWYGGYAKQAETNPQGPKTGTSRVFRGGGWNGITDSADRHWPDPKVRDIDLGFRCARGR